VKKRGVSPGGPRKPARKKTGGSSAHHPVHHHGVTHHTHHHDDHHKPDHHHEHHREHPSKKHPKKKPAKKTMPAKQYAEYIKWLNEHHFTKKQRAEFDKKKRERQKKKRAEGRKRREVQAAGGDLMSKRRGVGNVRVGPPTPPYTMSPSQYGAYLKHLNSVQYTRAERYAYNQKKNAGQRPQPTRRTVQLASAPVPGGWILGGNDRYTDCGAVALANSLLGSTGVRAGDADILRLHLAASDGLCAGASIDGILRAAADLGLAGSGPAACEMLDDGEPLEDGLILDLDLAEAQLLQDAWDWHPAPDWGTHAAVLAGDCVITWGGLIPVTPEFLEFQVAAAWRVIWEA
jgi:hypothetical protein